MFTTCKHSGLQLYETNRELGKTERFTTCGGDRAAAAAEVEGWSCCGGGLRCGEGGRLVCGGGGSSFEGGAPRFLSSHSRGSPDFAPLIAGRSLVMCCDSEALMLKIEKLLHIHLWPFVFSVECASRVQSTFWCDLAPFNLLRHQEHKFVYL